ncbi:ATP-binding cassette domain-containing protein [Halosimplex marinum]|uniref:ATP-binding cassette domain-containing protein n=1 Tax=Halosimplex marinum TaxID=3396620 RepID=UPI003F5639AF
MSVGRRPSSASSVGSKHRPTAGSSSTGNPLWSPVPTGPWYSRSIGRSRGCPSGRTSPSNWSVPGLRRTDRVREPLELVGLDDRAETHPSELSGGTKRPVALARALAVDPGTLLLAEPFESVNAQRAAARIGVAVHPARTGQEGCSSHTISKRRSRSPTGCRPAGTPGRVREDVRVDLHAPAADRRRVRRLCRPLMNIDESSR